MQSKLKFARLFCVAALCVAAVDVRADEVPAGDFSLCDAVTEGLQLLETLQLPAPSFPATKEALLSALLLASEPGAIFLDESEWAGRYVSADAESEDVAAVVIEELPVGMGYMRVADFRTGVGAEISAGLDAWTAAGKIGAILDLRGVAGTAVDEIPAVATKFLPMGATFYSVLDRRGKELSSISATRASAATLPVIVLVNESTCGAAERLAAVLAGSVKGVMVIGRPTVGDPMIREPHPIAPGRVVLLATRQLKMSDGTVYDGSRGITPGVLISDSALAETVYEPETPFLRKGKTLSDEEKEDRALRDRTANDTYLRRATDVLLGLAALQYVPPR